MSSIRSVKGNKKEIGSSRIKLLSSDKEGRDILIFYKGKEVNLVTDLSLKILNDKRVPPSDGAKELIRDLGGKVDE